MGDTLTLEETPEGEFDIIPEDTILEAKITKVEVETTKMIDEATNEPVKQVVFTFKILDDPWVSQNRLAWGRTSTKFTTHEKCKLRAWVTEIMSVDSLPTGFRLDLDSLVGQQARIVMEEHSYVDKKGKVDENGEFPVKKTNRVKEVIRSRGAGRPAVDEEPFS